ncbi:MAG: hypothetical protein JXB14_03535 [Candidatus Altiarchaeota archaeon]|nr:hypothetical protein [Candidatus Altiarchaeota archaeon]
MGKEKHLKRVMELFERSPVVDVRSIARIVGSEYHKQLLRNLVLQNRIRRLTKGYYTIHDDPSLAVFCFKSAYLGLQDALSFHGLWEQETIPIVITGNMVRPGVREVLGNNVLVRRMDKRYLFGFDLHEQGGVYLPYSDIEKTLIDMVYFGERLEDESIRAVKRKIDKERLAPYLNAYPSRTKEAVLSLLNG